jgi:hypothetical protein
MGYSNQYLTYVHSPEWKNKSKSCQQLTKNHCVVFPWLKSNHCHHLTYKNLKNEIPIRDTVPLSKTAHSIIHWGIFWKTPLRLPINYLLRLLTIIWAIFWFIFGK